MNYLPYATRSGRWSFKSRASDHFYTSCASLQHEEELLISLLKSCNDTSEVSQIHGRIVKTGLHGATYILSNLLASSIVDVKYASSIFNSVERPNLFMYTTMLRAFSTSNNPDKSLLLFNNIRGATTGIIIDPFAFIPTLKSCARLFAFQSGRTIHALTVRSGHGTFTNVHNALLSFYCRCRRVEDAQRLFDELSTRPDSVTWNTMIGGYLDASQPHVSIELFRRMRSEGLGYDVTTLSTVLSACVELGSTPSPWGICLHGSCIKAGFCSDLYMRTSLVNMYVKSKQISSGEKLFRGGMVNDVVLWNCLVDGYARSGMLEDSLVLLKRMKEGGVKPNSSTLAGLILSCAEKGDVRIGRCLYEFVHEEDMVLDDVLGTALVDMHCKLGFLNTAEEVFERMVKKDVKSWTAMISGYGAHGRGSCAVELLNRMEEEGVQPNEVTFIAILSACSHGGMVDEAMNCYRRMVCDHGIVPVMEHYGCMIDVFSRVGMLEEARKLIERMPTDSDATTWRAFLAGCRVHGDARLGEFAKDVLTKKACGEHPADLLLLWGSYAVSGRVPRLRMVGKEATMAKQAGHSVIQMDNK